MAMRTPQDIEIKKKRETFRNDFLEQKFRSNMLSDVRNNINYILTKCQVCTGIETIICQRFSSRSSDEVNFKLFVTWLSFSFTLSVMLIIFTPVSYPFVVVLPKQLYRKLTAMF